MSVSPTLTFPVSAESQAEAGQVRVEQSACQAIPGSDPPRESDGSHNHSSDSNFAQDEGKVQMEPAGEIAVYKFLDQNGNLVLHVPPQQLLDLAQTIAQTIDQELPQGASPKKQTALKEVMNNGH